MTATADPLVRPWAAVGAEYVGSRARASRRYYLRNKDLVIARSKARAKADPDSRAKISKRSYLRNKALVIARSNARAKADPERHRADVRRWREANPMKNLEIGRAYRERNREARTAASREWQRTHPEVHAHNESARRSRRYANGGSHTLAEWHEKCALLGNVCIYCGEAKPLTRDHKVPIARGGSDFIENIVPACKSCNCRKSKRTAQEFIRARR
jgi:5-methylcytosine-specific restriction endonuclease McrA